MKPYTPDFVKTLPEGANDPVSAAIHAITKSGPTTAAVWAEQLSAASDDLSRLAATIPQEQPKPALGEILGDDIKILTSTEIEVLSKILGCGYPAQTFTAVAAEKCLSRERIRQIHQKAIAKLREVCDPKDFARIFEEPKIETYAINLGAIKIENSGFGFSSYLILGNSGSGKTCIAKNITSQLLTVLNKPDTETKPGALILDNKDNYAAPLYKVLKAHNRVEDLITLELDGDHTLNLMFGPSEDIEEQGKCLVKFLNAVADDSLKGPTLFEFHALLHAIEAVYLQLAVKAQLGEQPPSLKTILDIIRANQVHKSEIDFISTLKIEQHRALLEKANRLISDTPLHAIRAHAITYLEDFCALEVLLGTTSKDTFSLQQIVTEGKIVVLNTERFPHNGAKMIPRLLANQLYQIAQLQFTYNNLTRQVVLTWEEWGFHINTTADSDQLAVSRSLKIIPVFTGQGLFSARIMAHTRLSEANTTILMERFGTKIFLNSSDSVTGAYLEKIAGVQKPFAFFPYFSEEKSKPKVPAERLTMLTVSKDRTEAYVAQSTASGLTVTRTHIPLVLPKTRSTAGFIEIATLGLLAAGFAYTIACLYFLLEVAPAAMAATCK